MTSSTAMQASPRNTPKRIIPGRRFCCRASRSLTILCTDQADCAEGRSVPFGTTAPWNG